MGGIIIEGRATLRCDGTIAQFKQVVGELESLSTRVQGLKILLLNPRADFPTTIGLHFKGSTSDFEPVLKGLEKIRASVAIDTVPMPEYPAIGTWPTPEHGASGFGWWIHARM